MWDFSWLQCSHEGGAFADLEGRGTEAAERGYNTLRVNVFPTDRYVPRGRNELHTIFERHLTDFREHYEEKYAATYGNYHLERIQKIGERFCICGDYLQGVARIRCTNPE
jgi:hypothetical protein